MTPPTLRVLLLCAAAWTAHGAAGESAVPDWRVTIASLWGGDADHGKPACAIGPDGLAWIGGAWCEPPPGVPVHGEDSGDGALLTIDTRLGLVLSATRLPGRVSAIAVDDHGLLVAAGSLVRLDPGGREIRWRGGPGGRKVVPDGDGGAWVWDGSTLTHVGEGGEVGAGMTAKGKDCAIDVEGRRYFTCGWRGGRSKTSGNPVHIPWIKARSFDGEELWHAYDFDGTELDSVSDMADSHPRKLHFGADGKLYMFGDSDGGNTAYRHDPMKLGGGVGDALKNTPFQETWRVFRSVHLLFVGRFDPADGSLERGSFFYGTLVHPEKDRKEVGTGDADGLWADAEGRVFLTGRMQCRIQWTDGAVHKQAAPIDRTAQWGNLAAAPEGYLAVFSPDLSRLEYCTGFGRGSEGAYDFRCTAVAGDAGGCIVVGRAKAVEGRTAREGLFFRDPLQDEYRGDGDVWFATLATEPAPEEPLALAREMVARQIADPTRKQAVAGTTRFAELAASWREAGAEDDAAVLDATGEFFFARAGDLIKLRALQGRELLRFVAEAWKGGGTGDRAKSLLDTLAADEVFQRHLAIDEIRTAFEEADASLRPAGEIRGAEEDHCADPFWLRANASAIRTMQRQVAELVEEHPDHDATAAVLARCRTLGVPTNDEEKHLLTHLGRFVHGHRNLRTRQGEEPDCRDRGFVRKNQRTLTVMARSYKALLKAAPEHPYTARARSLAEAIHLGE